MFILTPATSGLGIKALVAAPNKADVPKVFAISAGVFGINEVKKSVGVDGIIFDNNDPDRGLKFPPIPNTPCVATGTAPSAIAACVNPGVDPNNV